MSVRFKSSMVNQKNQQAGKSWGPDKLALRVLNRRKPMMVEFFRNIPQAENFIQRVRKAAKDIGASVDLLLVPKWKRKYVQVMVSNKGTLEELFDLKTLFNDYVKALGRRGRSLFDEFLAYRNHRLIDFVYGWDVYDVPPWVTGLILGYPVENTIQIYKEP